MMGSPMTFHNIHPAAPPIFSSFVLRVSLCTLVSPLVAPPAPLTAVLLYSLLFRFTRSSGFPSLPHGLSSPFAFLFIVVSLA